MTIAKERRMVGRVKKLLILLRVKGYCFTAKTSHFETAIDFIPNTFESLLFHHSILKFLFYQHLSMPQTFYPI